MIDEMQHEADQNETSLNVLVNQVLKRYAEWDRYESKIGMMPVPKVMLSSLIDKSIAISKENIGIRMMYLLFLSYYDHGALCIMRNLVGDTSYMKIS
jgi:hypothetical protein